MNRDDLRAAIRERAFLNKSQSVSFSPTGEKVSWIFDFRTILLDAPVLDSLCEHLWKEIGASERFQIGGMETASIPLISGLLLKSRQNGKDLTGFYMRKSRDKDGRQRMIEGTLTDEKIILVDDLMNSGKSFIRQITALEALGKKVDAVCVVLRFKEPSFYQYFADRNIRIISLFSLADFPEAVEEPRRSPPPTVMPFDIEWKFESTDPNYFYVIPKSAPVLGDPRLYYGSDNGTFWALNQSDGTVAWSYKVRFGGGDKRIFSSPALSIKHGLVCFGAYDGNLYALGLADGKKRWTFMDADWIGSSPVISEKNAAVYVGLEFGLWRKRGGIAAINLDSGKKLWSHTVEHLVHASPVISEKHQLVMCGDNGGTVHALHAADGSPAWQYQAGGEVKASFALDESGEYVAFGSFDKHVYVLKTKTGELIWKYETLESIYASPMIADGRVYIGGLDKYIYCFELATGKRLWRFETKGRVFATPVIINERLYVGSNDGRLYELDPVTGKELGFFQSVERIVNKIAYNPTTETYFVPTFANEMYCLKRAVPTA